MDCMTIVQYIIAPESATLKQTPSSAGHSDHGSWHIALHSALK